MAQGKKIALRCIRRGIKRIIQRRTAVFVKAQHFTQHAAFLLRLLTVVKAITAGHQPGAICQFQQPSAKVYRRILGRFNRKQTLHLRLVAHQLGRAEC